MNQLALTHRLYFILFFIGLVTHGCKQNSAENVDSGVQPDKEGQVTTGSSRFKKLDSAICGVSFSNLIKEDYTYNVLNFEYLYNGGGVAIGDINNDNLPDLYFTGTFVPNKLYQQREYGIRRHHRVGRGGCHRRF
jgi:hypothetical protein